MHAGEVISFADVAEACRAFGETAIALVRADGSLVVAPPPGHPVKLEKGDSVAVLAQEYDFEGKKAV